MKFYVKSKQKNKCNKVGSFFRSFSLCVACFLLVASCVHLDSLSSQLLVLLASVIIPLVLTFYKAKIPVLFKLINCVVFLSLFLVTFIVSLWEKGGRYYFPDINRQDSYDLGKVMVLVPHHDDEINCAGGVMGEWQKYGNVYVVYYTIATNSNRYSEAKRAVRWYEIPETQVLCMAYSADSQRDMGKGWQPLYYHMYNMGENEVAIDRANKNHKWKLEGEPGVVIGTPFTRNNLKKDIIRIIEDIKPDTIVCVDYDSHPDHRALSLLFEESMCEIMRSDISYNPFILKSFAYSTAWLANPDFYTENIKSTHKVGNKSYMPEHYCYNWDSRLRLPVSKQSLTRILSGNHIWKSLMEHTSQVLRSPNTVNAVVNGDKVYWWRPTGNLLLSASVKGDGAHVEHLNDFKLFDSHNIADKTRPPLDHGWAPDKEKDGFSISLAFPSVIEEIWLYDHISPENQLQRLTITLSNGQIIKVQELPSNGAAKIIKTGCLEKLDGFVVRVEQMKGEKAGLAEIEAYCTSPKPPIQVTKLVDANDDFMYDYTLRQDGYVEFSIYTWPKKDTSGYGVYFLNNDKKVKLFPERHSHIYSIKTTECNNARLEVWNEKGQLVDVVRVQKPTEAVRLLRRCLQSLDLIMTHRCLSGQWYYYRYKFHRLTIFFRHLGGFFRADRLY